MSAAPRVLVVRDHDFPGAAAEKVAALLRDAVRTRPRISVLLSGGSTPKPVYEELAARPRRAKVPWTAITWFFGDERCVPVDDARSNFAMVRRALFDRADLPLDHLRRLEADAADPDAAARAYERLLPAELDLVLLGIGADGHCASLFPRSPALGERRRRVVRVDGPDGGPARLTVTPPVLAQAREIVVLAAGAAKAPMVVRALAEEGDPGEVPARLARRGLWILDESAAASLPAGLRGIS